MYFISENCYAKTLKVKVQGYEIAVVIWCILHVYELCITCDLYDELVANATGS